MFVTHFLRKNLINFRKFSRCVVARKSVDNDFNNENSTELPEDDQEYKLLAESCFGLAKDYNCYIIHPYVKWGRKKVVDTKPDQQIQEAVALINTLHPWRVHDTLAIPLDNLDKKELFGSGTLEKLKQKIRSDPKITAVFVNVGTLKTSQAEVLERIFKVPIMDRYKIVMHILRLHAISKHAKLQVALAEIPYLRAKIKKHDTHFMASSDYDTKRVMLQTREQKIKNSIKKLRSQRQLLRNRRNQLDYPVIAVVGYTNAGKTSLIKALTGDNKLIPKDQLFATLDVTMHAGLLPSSLQVLYVDTVGFISNIPTDLIECFVATLEDVLYADVILHVEDLASPDLLFQRKHVLQTLENLAKKSMMESVLKKMISVGNKCDLVKTGKLPELAVSAKQEIGIDTLRYQLEKNILENTERSVISIRLPIGGDETRWLYKNSAVTSVKEDSKDAQFQIVKVIITNSKLQQFKHHYLKQKNDSI